LLALTVEGFNCSLIFSALTLIRLYLTHSGKSWLEWDSLGVEECVSISQSTRDTLLVDL